MTSILKRKLNNRLMELSPRAFEFFAGDLLEYLGLESVRVTRLSGDGGIDAECRMVSGGLVQVPAGVQVKRQKQPVGRPVIDRFIGALANRYSCGIFVTTSAFSQPAREKAESSIPYVSPIDGAMVAGIMVVGRIGVLEKTQALDEGYFSAFEERVERARSKASYPVHQPPRVDVTPADDLISLRALSHALHVDTTTIRDWIDKGRLSPDDRAGSTNPTSAVCRKPCGVTARFGQNERKSWCVCRSILAALATILLVLELRASL